MLTAQFQHTQVTFWRTTIQTASSEGNFISSLVLCQTTQKKHGCDVTTSQRPSVHLISLPMRVEIKCLSTPGRWSRGITPLIVSLDTRWRWVLKARPRLVYLRKGTPMSTKQKAEWVPDLVWTSLKTKEHLTLPGFEPRVVHPVARHISTPIPWILERRLPHYQSTLRNILEEHRCHLHGGGSLKSRKTICVYWNKVSLGDYSDGTDE